MKQVKLLFFSLSILIMLFAGGCADTDDGLTRSPETQPTEQITNPSMESSPEPIMQTSSPSDERLTYTSNTPDANFIRVDYLTEALLEQYKSYDEYVEPENAAYQVKILFEISATVKDVRFLVIYLDESGEDGSLNFYVDKTLYSMDTLPPEKPLVVGTVFEGLLPTRAISFVDENNTTRYYSVEMSGKDGSIFLSELVPRETS